jgi:transcription antitermination factor NusG
MTLIDLSDDELPPRAPLPVADLRWYAVRVAPQCEAKAAHDLRAAGVTVFAPTCRAWRKRRRGRLVARWRHIERPLLVGYILVGVQRPGDWLHIRAAEGYGYTVSQDGEPIRIPESEIVNLQIRVISGEFDEDKRPRKRRNPYRRGDLVTVSVAGMTAARAVVIGGTGEHIIAELVASGLRVRAPVDSVGLDA